ncbi:glutaminase [Marinilongibacter aquaticus]|uniref:glutaminase n=1 Tax=Marinilongibacter aquaticus TaxID=2975157 RepID=UPI0021BDC592|nr:glutaminase [Marinilongibacter aquaticus]UBM59039.1 glutaminase [Marinilongibacter aquaticus]
MKYKALFGSIYEEIKAEHAVGQTAQYIPALKEVDPSKFGVYLSTLKGHDSSFGDSLEPFSIQSIAKVLSLTMAFNLLGEKLWQRVGVEPPGTPFNSLLQLEADKGIPRNPMINAGALVIADILVSAYVDPYAAFLSFLRELTGNDKLHYSNEIAESEKTVSYRNAALINLMKDFGNIENDIQTVLDFYFHLCSIKMTCAELSKTFLFLANEGTNPRNNSRILDKSKAKRMNAIMQLCGFYDEAGEFSFRVGLPGKSGVGGGIAAVLPGQYSIAVWSPRLNKKGNSHMGMLFLEKFTTATESSIF